MTSHLKLVHSVATVTAPLVQAKVAAKAAPSPALKVTPTAKKKATRKNAQPTPQELLSQNVMDALLLDINFDEIVHLTGDSDGINLNNDPIVSSGSAELSLRKIIAKYGFHRLPLTYGELHGLLDYCERLDSTYGLPHFSPAMRAKWQPSALAVFCEYHPEHAGAVHLFCRGETEALAKLHLREDTLTNLGINYVPDGS